MALLGLIFSINNVFSARERKEVWGRDKTRTVDRVVKGKENAGRPRRRDCNAHSESVASGAYSGTSDTHFEILKGLTRRLFLG